jgi:hypothetical protein
MVNVLHQTNVHVTVDSQNTRMVHGTACQSVILLVKTASVLHQMFVPAMLDLPRTQKMTNFVFQSATHPAIMLSAQHQTHVAVTVVI